MTFTKKSTQTTEVVLGTAVNNLRKASTELTSAVEVVNKLADTAENLSGQIAEREGKIKELDTEFAERKRQAQVTLELDIKSMEQTAVDSILNRQGKISVLKAEYDGTITALNTLKSEMQKEIAKETAIVTNRLTKEFETEKKLAQSQFDGQQAQTKAELSQKEQQIAFLSEQVNMWKKALDDERQAGVERAKAGAIGSINLGGNQGR